MVRMMIAASGLVLLFATAAVAQRSSGTLHCQAANPIYVIHVPDGPNHVISVDQLKCTWIKRMNFLGLRNTEGVGTGCDDVNGRTIHTHGYFVDTMENGDRVYWKVEGGGTLKEDSNLERSELKIAVTGGTGRFSKARGDGTCIGKGNADGSSIWECEVGIEAAK
jgi:hypothetical protein